MTDRELTDRMGIQFQYSGAIASRNHFFHPWLQSPSKGENTHLAQVGTHTWRLGSVDEQGCMHRYIPLTPDEYIGVVDPHLSVVHSGAAMLLLVLPALETQEEDDSASKDE